MSKPLRNFSRAFVVFLVWAAAALPASSVEGREASAETSPIPAAASAHPVVGERLSFHGRWMGIPVGSGWIEVKEIVEVAGRKAYHIEIQGHTNDVLSTFYPIHDSVHSYLDVETLQPLRFEKHQREGHYRSDEVVLFDHQAHRASYQSLLNGSTKEIPLPEAFQDLVSALYWFRAQPLQPDQQLTLQLYTDEKLYETAIQIKDVLPLELLKRGTFRCVVVEPKASFKGLLVKRGRLWAYVTADAHRIPLLVKASTPWGQMSAVIDEESIPAGVVRQ